VRTDVIDAAGVITIGYNSHLHHIGLGKRRNGTKVTVFIDDLDIRVLHRDTGTLIRKLVLDPTRDCQPRGVKCGNYPKTGCRCKPCHGTSVNDVPRHDTSAPGRTRTCDLGIRRPLLYPAELRRQPEDFSRRQFRPGAP
jgi:hypothetical protein